MRESNFYKKEAEKMANFIKTFNSNKNEYPPTTIKFYKYGRVK